MSTSIVVLAHIIFKVSYNILINHLRRAKTICARCVQIVMRLIDRKSDRDQGVFLNSSGVRIIPIKCALGGRERVRLNHHANALFAVPSFLPAPRKRRRMVVGSGGRGERVRRGCGKKKIRLMAAGEHRPL